MSKECAMDSDFASWSTMEWSSLTCIVRILTNCTNKLATLECRLSYGKEDQEVIAFQARKIPGQNKTDSKVFLSTIRHYRDQQNASLGGKGTEDSA